MSVLIKGMDMPTSCWRCTLSQLYEKPREMLVCKITHEEVLRHKIDGNCPLVPVPPHGRLIDADMLMMKIKEEGRNQAEQLATTHDPVVRAYGDCYDLTKRAPTVIEAEE